MKYDLRNLMRKSFGGDKRIARFGNIGKDEERSTGFRKNLQQCQTVHNLGLKACSCLAIEVEAETDTIKGICKHKIHFSAKKDGN